MSFISLLVVMYFTGILGKEAVSYYKLPDNVEYVVFGHSHPECAYNDSLIDNFKNLANSGEAYFYTYLKARKILPENKQIEVVFIEYFNNQIIKEMDNWTWDDTYLPIRLPTYLPLMDCSDLRLLFDNNPKMFRNQIIKAILKNIIHSYKTIATKNSCLVKDNNMRFGGYSFRTKSVVDSLITNSKIKDEKKHILEISQLNIKYLEETIRLCKKYKKKVILIRTPVHESTPSLDFEEKYKEILDNRFANIEYIDFINFKLKNTEFYDFGHLNSYGARKFSEWFNTQLNNGLLNATDKQAAINTSIEARTHNRVARPTSKR